MDGSINAKVTIDLAAIESPDGPDIDLVPGAAFEPLSSGRGTGFLVADLQNSNVPSAALSQQTAAGSAGPTTNMVGILTGLGVLGLVAGAGSGSSSKPSSAPSSSPSAATGVVIAGPIMAGNDLQIDLFAADGTTLLGTASLDDTGRFSISLNGYSGVVIAKVSDQNNVLPDYIDEATGQPKDLGGILLAVGVAGPSGIVLYVNPLTSIAALLAGLNANGQLTQAAATLTPQAVATANLAVAEAFGLGQSDDLVSPASVIPVIDQGGNFVTNADNYGKLLAVLSGLDDLLSQNPIVTIQTVAQDIQNNLANLGSAQLSPEIKMDLVMGGMALDPAITEDAVEAVKTTTEITVADIQDYLALPGTANDPQELASLLAVVLDNPAITTSNLNQVVQAVNQTSAASIATLANEQAFVQIFNGNTTPTGSVSVSGTATEGQALTAANTLADADGMGTVSYQWQSSANGTTWADITGATASTYTLTQAEVGKQVRAVASYTDAQGTPESVNSSATSSVANSNDSPTGSVSVSGAAIEGQALTAANTLADADGMGTVSYQWQSSANGTTWADITGATASTYTLTQAEVGKQVRAVASYTDAQGTPESAFSGGTTTVAAANTPFAVTNLRISNDSGPSATDLVTNEQWQTLHLGLAGNVPVGYHLVWFDGAITNLVLKSNETPLQGTNFVFQGSWNGPLGLSAGTNSFDLFLVSDSDPWMADPNLYSQLGSYQITYIPQSGLGNPYSLQVNSVGVDNSIDGNVGNTSNNELTQSFDVAGSISTWAAGLPTPTNVQVTWEQFTQNAIVSSDGNGGFSWTATFTAQDIAGYLSRNPFQNGSVSAQVSASFTDLAGNLVVLGSNSGTSFTLVERDETPPSIQLTGITQLAGNPDLSDPTTPTPTLTWGDIHDGDGGSSRGWLQFHFNAQGADWQVAEVTLVDSTNSANNITRRSLVWGGGGNFSAGFSHDEIPNTSNGPQSQTISVELSDAYGNTATSTFNFNLDTPAPVEVTDDVVLFDLTTGTVEVGPDTANLSPFSGGIGKFKDGETYDIYIRVNSLTSQINWDEDLAWFGASNLGSDDQITLIGNDPGGILGKVGGAITIAPVTRTQMIFTGYASWVAGPPTTADVYAAFLSKGGVFGRIDLNASYGYTSVHLFAPSYATQVHFTPAASNGLSYTHFSAYYQAWDPSNSSGPTGPGTFALSAELPSPSTPQNHVVLFDLTQQTGGWAYQGATKTSMAQVSGAGSFNPNDTYEIYIRIGALNPVNQNLTPLQSSNITPWTGANNLGADDQIQLVQLIGGSYSNNLSNYTKVSAPVAATPQSWFWANPSATGNGAFLKRTGGLFEIEVTWLGGLTSTNSINRTYLNPNANFAQLPTNYNAQLFTAVSPINPAASVLNAVLTNYPVFKLSTANNSVI